MNAPHEPFDPSRATAPDEPGGDEVGLDGTGFDETDLDDELDDDTGALGLHLRALLAPEDDLGKVTTHEVDRALRGRSVFGTALELLGVGWVTAREVLSDGAAAADGEGEGT
jgi:hypothetical protein